MVFGIERHSALAKPIEETSLDRSGSITSHETLIMKIKPHIFIGSSSEGLPAAQVLKTRLSWWANCDIWKDPGVFE